MISYIIQRLLQGVVVLFLVTFFTFALMQLAPGDPIDLMVGEAIITDEQIARIQEKWGLDKPWYQQYFTWLSNFFRGDLGHSVVRTGYPVSDMVIEAMGPTLKLNVMALILAVILALPAGLFAAVKQYSVFDSAIMVWASAGVALPNFWVGLMLIVFFSRELGWLPSYGTENWKGWIMPVVVLAINETAILARLMRGATLEVVNQEYVTTARAKGLAERAVLLGHIVRNALLPIVTVLGLRAAFLLSGTIVVEYIFAVPGIGRLFIQSVDRLDYQVIQAITVMFVLFVIVATLVTDMLYAVIDPRIRVK
ncbi:MAG TPA: ABC transporter permease [Thermomicrobiales bacterium]|nr:ABC transporter permease [Thermomicrobiales bacterium]